jgi:hypothetical protein
MSQVLLEATAPATGDRFGMGGASLFQLTVFSPDAGAAVTAEVVIEVTNDVLAWLPLLTLSISGTGVASVANVSDIPWDSVRARLTNISANSKAIVTFNTKSGRI